MLGRGPWEMPSALDGIIYYCQVNNDEVSTSRKRDGRKRRRGSDCEFFCHCATHYGQATYTRPFVRHTRELAENV